MSEQGAEDQTSWRRLTEDGVEWEARMVSGPEPGDPEAADAEEILEFVCVSGTRKPRRLAVRPGSLPGMTGDELHRAYVQARPIGGDHYGRPGKQPTDAG